MARLVLIGLALILAVALGVSVYRFNASNGSGLGLSGATQAEFVRSATQGCLTRQKAAAENASVAPEIIASYCACYGTELAKRFATADIERLRGRSQSDMQTAMRPKMVESEDVCFAKLDGEK